MNPKEIEWEVVNVIHLALSRDHRSVFVNTIMNLQVPLNAEALN